jgi:hypothetical protein
MAYHFNKDRPKIVKLADHKDVFLLERYASYINTYLFQEKFNKFSFSFDTVMKIMSKALDKPKE